MNKHAYLIIAHNEFEILEKNLRLIDSEFNDIYILIDKKVKSFDFEYYRQIPKKSKVFFVPRVSIYWGEYSQVKAEMVLIEQATKHDYSYLHLISGVDMLIKPAKQVYEFFEQHSGKEFMEFVSEDERKVKTEHRLRHYHFFVKWKKSSNKFLNVFFSSIRRGLLFCQRVLKINRIKGFEAYSGSNWASITGEFAKYLVEQKRFIKKHFNHTMCGDEEFLQTMLKNSQFKDNVYKNSNGEPDYKREIDWTKGNPHVFTIQEFDELLASDNFFARKFSYKKDSEVVEKIYSHIMNA